MKKYIAPAILMLILIYGHIRFGFEFSFRFFQIIATYYALRIVVKAILKRL